MFTLATNRNDLGCMPYFKKKCSPVMLSKHANLQATIIFTSFSTTERKHYMTKGVRTDKITKWCQPTTELSNGHI